MPTLRPDLDRRSYDKIWRADFAPADWGMPLLLEGGLSCQRVPIGLDQHSHPGYELHFLKRGSFGIHCEDGSHHELRGGQFSLTLPGVRHGGDDGIIRPSDFLWLVIDPRRRGAERRTPFDRAGLRELRRVFDGAGNAVAQAPADTIAVFDDLLAQVRQVEQEGLTAPIALRLVMLLGAFVQRAFEAFSEPQASEDGGLGRRADLWLQQHIYEDIGVDDLAAAMELGLSRLHDRFREEQGETPAHALRRLRCVEAARVLRDTDRSIALIAEQLHFASPQHFARVFRNFNGCAPSAFREQER